MLELLGKLRLMPLQILHSHSVLPRHSCADYALCNSICAPLIALYFCMLSCHSFCIQSYVYTKQSGQSRSAEWA